MVCAEKRKVWVHIKPHRKRVWKCFDEKPQRRKKKITGPLNLADFVRAPGYRRSKRKIKKKKPPRIQLRPPAAARAAARLPRRDLRINIKRIPVVRVHLPRSPDVIPELPRSTKPIKYDEDYQLQKPIQFRSKKKSKRRTATAGTSRPQQAAPVYIPKDDPIVLD